MGKDAAPCQFPSGAAGEQPHSPAPSCPPSLSALPCWTRSPTARAHWHSQGKKGPVYFSRSTAEYISKPTFPGVSWAMLACSKYVLTLSHTHKVFLPAPLSVTSTTAPPTARRKGAQSPSSAFPIPESLSFAVSPFPADPLYLNCCKTPLGACLPLPSPYFLPDPAAFY